MSNPKYVFLTGGVVSSVGKGVTAAAIGRILKARGLKVAIQKLDPYLNVDPGTMSPYQHGEVFVTSDGAETDLDLGHYERFIDEELNKTCNVTAGQVYSHIIGKERQGDYLGGTIQVVPHITNEIRRRIKMVSLDSSPDVVLVEVGGTVGDIEGQPFLEAIRQMRQNLPREDTCYVHVTFLPYIGATGELKTKPTQHSVRDLRSVGIQPHVIIARTDHPVSKDVTQKIALFCDVDESAVIPLETTDLLYDVPLALEDAGLGEFIVKRLQLDRVVKPPALDEWRAMVRRMRQPKRTVRIGIIGKYVELHDAYMSVKEAVFHAASLLEAKVDIAWIHSEKLERGRDLEELDTLDGIVVPGGFGPRGIEGKILAARYARQNKVPYLGLCLGMQTMCIEFARNVLGRARGGELFDVQGAGGRAHEGDGLHRIVEHHLFAADRHRRDEAVVERCELHARLEVVARRLAIGRRQIDADRQHVCVRSERRAQHGLVIVGLERRHVGTRGDAEERERCADLHGAPPS